MRTVPEVINNFLCLVGAGRLTLGTGKINHQTLLGTIALMSDMWR